METSLHRQLKQHFAANQDQVEISLDGFRIDAIDDEGVLVEIQHSGLGAIRKKISSLLSAGHHVRVIKPWIGCKWIETLDRPDGVMVRRRRSPKKLQPIDIFRELIHFTQVFPHPNLRLEVHGVECVEQRIDRPNSRWRRKQYQVLDQHLLKLREVEVLSSVADLWRLLNDPKLPSEFDTREMAEAIGRPRWLAQQIVYTLHHCGGLRAVSKRGNSIVYRRIKRRAPKKVA